MRQYNTVNKLEFFYGAETVIVYRTREMSDIQKAERQFLNKFTNMYTYKYILIKYKNIVSDIKKVTI